MLQQIRRPVAVIIAVLLSLLRCIDVSPASAQEPAKAKSTSAAVIAHGRDLRARDVGPAAAQLSSRAMHPGGEIHSGRAYPFAQRIERPAVYDGFDVGEPHVLIERVTFTGPLDIYERLPVVLRGVAIRPERAADWALHTRPGAGRVYILWSEMAAASTDGAPGDRTHVLSRALYLRSERVTVYRSHLTRAADGIQIHAPGVQVIESLIDGLVYWNGDHNDGIQMLGRGADVQIVRSRIENPNPQTSALNLIGDRVLVEASYLSGGGWTVYAGAHHTGRVPGSTHSVVVRGNVFGREFHVKGGSFGPVTGYDAAGAGNLWSDNRWTDGTPLLLGR